MSIFVLDPPENSIFLPSAIGFDLNPWFGFGQPIDLTPETVDVARTTDPAVYVANTLALAPERLEFTATAAELGIDPTTITSAAFFVRRPDGTTEQWSATSSATVDQITAVHDFVDGDLPQAESLRICAVWGLGGTGGTLTDGSGNVLTDGSGNPLTDGATGGVIRSRGFTLIVLD